MTAKQFLGRARAIDQQIDSLLQTKQKLLDRLLSVTQNYEADGAQTSKDPHKYDGLVIIENKIDRLIDEMLTAKAEALDVISQIRDWRVREVLKQRYVDTEPFEQIAVSMHYGWRNILKLHKRGIMEVDEILNERNRSV